MCVICGCDSDAGHDHPEGHAGDPAQALAFGPVAGVATSLGPGNLHFGTSAARVSVPGMSQARAVKLEADVLGANKRMAQCNRAHFAAHGVTAFNLVSSPGSGKTTLLCATIAALAARMPRRGVAVIEGDQHTSLDAERIRATGAPAIQVNTGRGCHLDAQMVGEAFARLSLHGDAHRQPHGPGALLFIENVGNLVCPAMWDLGEAAKIVILSVTEGDDKPLKYPDMFAAAALMVIHKIDLLPHVDFDVSRCVDAARRVNPAIAFLPVSATRGTGLQAWLDWLLAYREEGHHRQPHRAQGDAEGALHEHIEALEERFARGARSTG